MKILYLSFYFPPDLSAGSFRNQSIIEELSIIAKKKNFEVDLYTNYPLRYDNYRNEEKFFDSKLEGINIYRCKNFSIKKNLFNQCLLFLKYFIFVLSNSKNKKYDIVFASSSRLFTGFLGALISKKVKANFYLDIRDIFLDSYKDVYKNSPLILFLPFLNIIEKYTISCANKINLISRGFKSYFLLKYGNKKYNFFTNGIDKIFINFNFDNKKINSKTNILYAGNIGDGQGIEKILPQLIIKYPNVHFNIIGDGSKLNSLRKKLISLGTKNYSLIMPIKRSKLLHYYREADLLFLHLNDIKAFEKVLPSKIFEYASTSKPILAGVKGYAKKFLEEEVSNCYIFDPFDIAQAEKLLDAINFKTIKRNAFIKKYDRKNISKQMINEIINL